MGGSDQAKDRPTPRRLRRRSAMLILLALVALLLLSMIADRLLPTLGVQLDRPTRLTFPPNVVVDQPKLEYRYTLRTNHLGLRDPERPFEKPTGVTRVILLGDVQTAGMAVPAEQTFAALLEKATTNTQFINCGKPWANVLHQLRILYHVGLRYQPDRVLLCISADELGDMPWKDIKDLFQLPPRDPTLSERLWPNLSAATRAAEQRDQYTRDKQPFDFIEKIQKRAKKKGLPDSDIQQWTHTVARYPKLVQATGNHQFNGNILSFGLLWNRKWPDALDYNRDYKEQAWRNMRKAMAAIRTDLRLQLAVVFIPVRLQYSPEYQAFLQRLGMHVRPSWLTDRTRFQVQLGRWCGDHAVPFLDLTDAFRSHPTPDALSHKYGAELTAQGHQLIADRITAAWDSLAPAPTPNP